jgi:hypothetical protein
MVSAAIGAQLDRVPAFIIGAVNQDAVDAGFPHFSEGSFLLVGGGFDRPSFRHFDRLRSAKFMGMLRVRNARSG